MDDWLLKILVIKNIKDVHLYLVCATSIMAVGCLVWLWERCNRKESGGRPRTSVFRMCTRVGNSAWSTTVNLWSLICGEKTVWFKRQFSNRMVKNRFVVLKDEVTFSRRWSKGHWRGGGRCWRMILLSCKLPQSAVSWDPGAPKNAHLRSEGLTGWRKRQSVRIYNRLDFIV